MSEKRSSAVRPSFSKKSEARIVCAVAIAIRGYVGIRRAAGGGGGKDEGGQTSP